MGPEAFTHLEVFLLAGPLTEADASVSGFFYVRVTQIGMGPEAVTASGGFSLAGPLTGADALVSGFFIQQRTEKTVRNLRRKIGSIC